MSFDAWHPEGIWQCRGCGRFYREYVNGCINADPGRDADHPTDRKVVLVVSDSAVANVSV